LHEALAGWDLLDGDASGEAVRNVVSSPLAGLDSGAVLDVRPSVRSLERRLASDAELHDLPGKFGFAIDDGGLLGLDAIPADIRFIANRSVDGPVFDIRLAGADGDRLGPCRPDALVDVAAALVRAFLRQRAETGARRICDLVSRRGVDAIACEAGLAHSCLPRPSGPVSPSAYLGAHALGSAGFLGIGLPFGAIAAEDFAKLASAAGANGARELRLTPWRAILLPVGSVAAARKLAAELAGHAFILDPADPRLRVAACPGAPACLRGSMPIRDEAAGLAAELSGVSGSGIMIHVSGCEKGCAHPLAAPMTLVGRSGRYDLIRGGCASDTPGLCDLTLEQVKQHVRGEAK
jgi:precorrin-3B synthase